MKINENVIKSRQNEIVKWAAGLSEKKGREESRAFLAEGVKLTEEAALSRLHVTHIFLSRARAELLLPKIKAWFADELYRDLLVVMLSEEAFAKVSTEKSPEGVICVIKYLDFFEDLDIINKEDINNVENERILALSSVRDPSNLGAILRSALAFGTRRVLLSADCADPFSPRTVRAAMGSLFRVKLTRVSDLGAAVSALRASGRRVFAAELREGASSLSEMSLLSSDVFIIGNEGHGIDARISSLCDRSVYIPISHATESLNASVAAGILMWEQSKL